MILGIMGKAGAGKDTFADLLVKEHGFVKIGLADEMKRWLKRVFDFSDEQLFGPSQARNAPDERYRRPGDPENDGAFLTPRKALQVLGTEFGRYCYENVWIDLALRTAKAVQGGQVYTQKRGLVPHHEDFTGLVGTPVVIPDVRFQNEFDAIRAVGGVMLRITRPGAGAMTHISETEQDSIPDHAFDHVYANTGTVDEMRCDILEWMKGLGK